LDSKDSFQQPQDVDGVDEGELSEISPDVYGDGTNPKYATTERIFRLLHLLTANDCTRQDIFERLKDHYKIGDDPGVRATSQRAGRMLRRDIQFLQHMGYKIKELGAGDTIRYSLTKGSGPGGIFLFSQSELDALILLHAHFADPTKYVQANARHPLPLQPLRNPFADQVISLIERLTATLPAEQKREFNRWARKPYVYFNQETVTDYLPHRETINTVVDAISRRQQIGFEYTSMQGTMPHEHVDPYYIVHQDGHLYLIGYSHKTTTVLEYRIDRINAESLKIQPDTIDVVRRRHPIEFSYWIDGSIAKSGLSQRWLTHTIEREELDVDEQGKPRRRVLVRAKAYSEWRIIQQLHKYGDKVELVDPPKLREWMKKEVERMYKYYQK